MHISFLTKGCCTAAATVIKPALYLDFYILLLHESDVIISQLKVKLHYSNNTELKTTEKQKQTGYCSCMPTAFTDRTEAGTSLECKLYAFQNK